MCDREIYCGFKTTKIFEFENNLIVLFFLYLYNNNQNDIGYL